MLDVVGLFWCFVVVDVGFYDCVGNCIIGCSDVFVVVIIDLVV